jgi:hypothetical protein
MKVTIAHSTTTTGLMRKTNYFDVTVAVQFSPSERGIIERYDLGVVNVLDRDPPAGSRDVDGQPDFFNLKIRHLLEGPNAYRCFTPLNAKSYDAQLRDALQKLKAYLDANATPMSGSDTFEL